MTVPESTPTRKVSEGVGRGVSDFSHEANPLGVGLGPRTERVPDPLPWFSLGRRRGLDVGRV